MNTKTNTILFLSALLALPFLSFATTSTEAAAADEITIGVLAKQGTDACVVKWGPLVKYLSADSGRTVRLSPLPFDQVASAVEKGKIDFLFTNPLDGIEKMSAFGGTPIASLISMRNGKQLNQFGGLIIVKADSDIQTLEDLKGKSLGCVKKKAFGGYKMQKRLLLENGIDPDKDCKLIKECKTHDKVVELVVKGILDAGTIRTDTLEGLVAKKKLDMADIRILNQFDDDFPFGHSTELYPEWPVIQLAGTDAGTADEIAKALQALSADHEAAKNAKIAGFSEPLSYEPVELLVEVLAAAEN